MRQQSCLVFTLLFSSRRPRVNGFKTRVEILSGFAASLTVAPYVILQNIIFVVAQEGTWNYNEQEKWPGECNTGNNQSPINIPKLLLILKVIPALKFANWDKAVATVVTNNGHSVLVKIPGSTKPALSGGGLSGTYNFENLHFHWPAEHIVYGQSFDLEAHFVFYSNKFPNFTEASKDKNGVAVIGVFYNRIETQGPAVFTILASAAQVVSQEVASDTTTEPIIFQDLLPNNPNSLYNYRGSLTTPECNEVVSWYILKNIGKINNQQYKSLTTIKGSNNQLLTFTNRKIQPLHGRPVYSTWF